MSRRFGRNQRRRMRGQLANEQAARELDRGLMRHISNELNELRSQLNWAKSHLVRYSFALKPQPIQVRRDLSKGHEQIHVEGSRPYNFATPDEAVSLLQEELRRTTLPVLVARWKIPRNDGAMHARVIYNHNQWAYAISPEAWTQQDEVEMIHMVAEELATQLVRDLKKWKDGDVF